MNKGQLYEELQTQKDIAAWENILTKNLSNLASALRDASNARLMSLEHASIIWKSYLKVSGMDVPKDLKTKVLKIIEAEKTYK